MKEKTKEEERKRILRQYKERYEADTREKEGNFSRIKRRKGIKKKKEGGYKYLSRDFARLYREEERIKGEKRGEEIHQAHQRNIQINANKIKRGANKTRVYIHKGDTKKPYKEIKPKIDKERGAGRFCIDFDIDIIEEIKARHSKSISELIEGAPILIRKYDWKLNKYRKYLKTAPFQEKITDILPYCDIPEEIQESINERFLREEYNDSTWKIGIKQFSLKGARIKKYIDITGEVKEIKVVAGKYPPIRSANEKKYLFGRKTEVNIYKEVEVKNRADYQKREKMPLYWRHIENGHLLLMDLQKELNTFCQRNNIETKKAWPYLKNLVESVNIRGYTRGNLDVLKNIWIQVQIIKERLLIENSAHQI